MRISVVGNSGSGKSTLSRAIAGRLGAPHIELDAIHNQSGWRRLPPDEFRERVQSVILGSNWIVDGNYAAVREMVWACADIVVWLDPPKARVMLRVTIRTLRRVLLKSELWNGNREDWSNVFTLDPRESVIARAWKRHADYKTIFLSAVSDRRWDSIRFIRVRTRRDLARLLNELDATSRLNSAP